MRNQGSCSKLKALYNGLLNIFQDTIYISFWLGNMQINQGFPGASEGKESVCFAGDPGFIPGSGRPLEEEMATHSSILA